MVSRSSCHKTQRDDKMPIYVPLPIMNILGASVLFFLRVPESVRFLARRHSGSWHHVRILSVVESPSRPKY